jgi:UDP-N-acetylmuramoyl-tripeptide--D-alanyl-D-alanine ligase
MNRLVPALYPVARTYRATALRRVRVITVIGSVGKTTTTRAVAAALDLPVRRQALFNASSTVPMARGLLTTVRPWHRRAVFEAAIGGYGEMARLAALARPNVVVVTAIARDHWKSFKTLEGTRDEKAKILRAMGSKGIAVMNADDPNVRWMATQTRARVVLIGQAPDAEVRVSEVEYNWPSGMRFTVTVNGVERPVETRLVGRHMVFPAVAAITVAHLEGVPLDTAIARVAALEPTPGRMQLMALPGGAHLIRDDFKSSQDPIEAALDTLMEVPARRRIVVLGELAESTGNDNYRDVGARVAAVADRAIFVGGGKNLKLYRTGAIAAGMDRERIDLARDAHEATQLLRDSLGEGDVVLTNGRWQQALGRIGLALTGRDVKCRADPCPFKQMLCDYCPFLEQEFYGLGEQVAGHGN